MMTINNDVRIGIQFLVRSRRHVSHGNQLSSGQAAQRRFPGFTHVQQVKRFCAGSGGGLFHFFL